MKDGEILKKISIFLIMFLLLPITITAIEIDKDMNSGIILSSEENIVPNDTVLSVSSVSDNNIINIAKSFGFKNYKVYNISLLENANRIIPNGEVTLSFHIPNNYNLNLPKQIFVIKAGDNNTVETVFATYQDDIGLYEELNINNGYAIINTSNFKLDSDVTYLIGTTADIIDTNNNQNTTTTTKISNPQTLDTDFAPLLFILIIGTGGIMLLFTKLYLDNKN